MPSRLTLAAGVLGVASLAFVGVGGYAAFTSNVNLGTSATAGTFILNAAAVGTGQACATGNTQSDCLFFDAGNYSTNQGSLSLPNNNTNITPGGNNASVQWTVPNMAPGDEYWSVVSLTDVGTLQGKVYQVTYNPPSNPTPAQAQLLADMTVTVQERTGTTTNSSGQSMPLWTNLPRVNGANVSSSQVGAGNYPANGGYAFSTAVSGGNVPFLQPKGTSSDEQNAQFRVIYTLSDSAGNGVEGQTVGLRWYLTPIALIRMSSPSAIVAIGAVELQALRSPRSPGGRGAIQS